MSVTLTPPPLSSSEVNALALAVAEKLPNIWLARSPVCATSEAMSYAKVNSRRSWRRFCLATGLAQISNGRYDCEAVARAVAKQLKGKTRFSK